MCLCQKGKSTKDPKELQNFFKIGGPKWPMEHNIVGHFLKRWVPKNGPKHICDAPWHFVPKCGKTWRRENAQQKWRNFTQLYFVAQFVKRHLLTSFKAQEAQIFYDFFAKKYFIMDWKIYTCDCLNNYLATFELEE